MRLVALSFIALMMVGCAETPTKVQIVEKTVPVIVVPAPPEIIKPKLEMATVTIEKDGYDNFVKALETDLVRMQSYTDELTFIINKYKELSKEHPNGTENNK